ncbi:MAG: cysteine--tRNA ligase [Mycobacteriales bacterium]
MSLALYDTRRREKVEFKPLRPGSVSMYVCGPTVQAPPHVGHLRPAVVFDVLRRWLTESGYAVTFARNVTDIDDKILDQAALSGAPWWALAESNTRAFASAYDALGVLPPTVEPRATAHVPQMIELIARLVEAGHAYPAAGDVYFDVRSFPAYGQLSGQRIDSMLVTERGDALAGKRDPLDFALWKAAKAGEPSWNTPWGPGRPGWHLECSVMATHYLGAAFDIHGGGLDLVFPHHENELAQSVGAGDPFARLWVHNGLVNAGDAKMSKSLGNSVFVSELLNRVRPAVLRYALLSAHYRSDLTWSESVLEEADSALGRIETLLRSIGAHDAALPPDAPEWLAFAEAMNDDLALPRALAVVHSAVREANAALAAGERNVAVQAAAVIQRMLAVLGLEVDRAPDARYGQVIDGLVNLVLNERSAARARRDFAAADRLRSQLTELGVVVEDTADGVRWRVE